MLAHARPARQPRWFPVVAGHGLNNSEYNLASAVRKPDLDALIVPKEPVPVLAERLLVLTELFLVLTKLLRVPTERVAVLNKDTRVLT